MSGYYDYHPTITLQEPVAIVGLAASGYRTIAHKVASTTGLPFVDIERLVEHHVGQSLYSLLQQPDGLHVYREQEAEILEKVLPQTPYGIILLGDSTLLNKKNLRQVRQNSKLIYLETSLKRIYQHLQASEEQQRYPFVPYPIANQKQLLQWQQERERVFNEYAHEVVSLKQGSYRAMHEVIDHLPVSSN